MFQEDFIIGYKPHKEDMEKKEKETEIFFQPSQGMILRVDGACFLADEMDWLTAIPELPEINSGISSGRKSEFAYFDH